MLRNIHFISFILYDMRNEVLYVSHYVLLFLCDNLGILCHVTYIMSHIQIYCYRLLYTVFLIKHTMCVYMYVCLRTSIYTHTHIYIHTMFLQTMLHVLHLYSLDCRSHAPYYPLSIIWHLFACDVIFYYVLSIAFPPATHDGAFAIHVLLSTMYYLSYVLVSCTMCRELCIMHY